MYRGDRLPGLVGAYVYGDHSTGRIWAGLHDGTKVAWHREIAATDREVLEDAEQLLADPALIDRISADIEAAGVAGEEDLRLTLYMIGTSRLLRRPLAGIVQGQSSSGKSYTIERVAAMFPKESVIHATQMTPQALFHAQAGSLSHRWVVAGERSRIDNDDKAEATRALREMLAAGRLSKMMPVKLGGEIKTVMIEQPGPIAFVGLLVPHLVRGFVGGAPRLVLPLSALVGAGFLPLADGLARMVVPGRDLPVGVLTATLGAPTLLWLLVRRRRG